MAFLEAFNISASGMTAQRKRLDIAAENLTNMSTTRTEGGGPYRRKMVVFESMGKNQSFSTVLSSTAARLNGQGAGVRVSEVIEDERPFKLVFDPDHPDANAEGYVEMPNVDMLKETVDAMAASRMYDANITAFNVIKSMATKALEIGK